MPWFFGKKESEVPSEKEMLSKLTSLEETVLHQDAAREEIADLRRTLVARERQDMQVELESLKQRLSEKAAEKEVQGVE